MIIEIDHYQDSGPLLAGRGTTTTLIINHAWMAAGSPEAPTSTYPIDNLVRPTGSTPFTYSYEYYSFFKISGTYPKASRPRITISGSPNGDAPGDYYGAMSGIRLYFALSDTYRTPDGTYDGDLTYYNNSAINLYPKVSTVGPHTGLSYQKYLSANTTYYSQYLVTRIIVEPGTSFGNLGELTFKCFVDEYEKDDV